MDQIELTASQQDRLDSLQSHLENQAGSYATVTPQDIIDYLLDIVTAVDDPNPQSAELSPTPSTDTARQPFPEQAIREQLTARRLNHSDPDAADTMDLYTIAVAFEISGRSSMQKAELIDAIIATAKQQYTNPFADVDLDFSVGHSSDTDLVETSTKADTDDNAPDGGDSGADDSADSSTEGSSADGDADNDDSGQLNAMLNLLETHDDKWRTADGDARYEVELPDGSIESARTKDDVRATLFKNY